MNLVSLWNQYIYTDVWVPVWPNLAASVIWVIPGFLWHKRSTQGKLDAQTAELKQHHHQVVQQLLEEVGKAAETVAEEELSHNA